MHVFDQFGSILQILKTQARISNKATEETTTPMRTRSQTNQHNQRTAGDSIAFIKLVLVTALVILVRCLEWILQKMILIYEKLPMIYNAARFCYEKPDLAQDLIRTSWHLAYVSYQSNLWTLSDAFDAFFGNSIEKMNEFGEKANEKVKRGGKSPNSPTKSPAISIKTPR
ncbi:unnamed protein product, partial [Mesorhabditis belari]|uniref:Uncharacterized protein n=1 Tax=Mesorhabditis belari TaxID=2138241 RepID=A0AAF3J7K8_9BILA